MSILPEARRKTPSQARAGETMRAIREAFLSLLRNDGASALTTNRIAEVAGVSIGSLYQYYRNKHSIALDICNETLCAEVGGIDRITEQTLLHSRQSLDETVAFMVRGHVQRERRLYELLRDFYSTLHWQYNFEAIMAEQFPHRRLTEDWLPRLFEHYAEQLRITDWPLAASLVVDVIEGTIHNAIDRHPHLLLDDHFTEELTALVLCYLKKP